MVHVSWTRLVIALFFSFFAYLVVADTFAAGRRTHAVGVELDQLIPREKWAGSGLDKLTGAEQHTLAEEITALLGARQSTESGVAGWKDKSNWRKLQRRMSKDDVRKLLGEPGKISATKLFEFWYYLGGSVTFDGKGRVDSWDEP